MELMTVAESEAFWLHKEYPKTCAPDDFWRQIKRTVKGQPVSQDQIDMIVNAVRAGLRFEQRDILLDLGCGNGALSRYFFSYCSGMLGVDFSTYLIEIAKKNFEKPPAFVFCEEDILTYAEKEEVPQRFTKALCYGVFPYLSLQDARTLLKTLRDRFLNLSLLFIGNLPDKERIEAFYPSGTNYRALINDNNSPIGIWRNREEMQGLAAETGWTAEFRTMPQGFYAGHYRFDALLRRST